jgi:hypothetical protein
MYAGTFTELTLAQRAPAFADSPAPDPHAAPLYLFAGHCAVHNLFTHGGRPCLVLCMPKAVAK